METVETKEQTRSPKRQNTDIEKLTGKLRSLANLNRQGTTKLFTPEQLYNRSIEYIEYCKNNPIYSTQLITGGLKGGDTVDVMKPRMLTIEGLCTYLGVHSKYMNELEQSVKGKEDSESHLYSNVLFYIRDLIRAQRFEYAAVNEFNSMFIAKLEGLTDKVEHSGEINNTVTSISFVQKSIEDVQHEELKTIKIDSD